MPESRLFVGGLNPCCKESDLENFFQGFGPIKDVTVKKRYGFVQFRDINDAIDAVDHLDGTEMLGYKVKVSFALPRQGMYIGGRTFRRAYGGRGTGRGRYGNSWQMKRGAGYRAIVKNVSSRVSWQELKSFMRQAGFVAYADVCGELNEGIVEYRSYTDLRRAIETLDNEELAGWKIRVIEEARDDRSRRYRRSCSTSRSPSRSRSRSRTRSSSRSRSRSESRSSPHRNRRR